VRRLDMDGGGGDPTWDDGVTLCGQRTTADPGSGYERGPNILRGSFWPIY
jgi:hypothetical protein